jgi:hypothetical protein
MKTIAQHVQDGISTLSDLQDALQTAMQLEFATIPPYLCAQWSINSDPSGVANMIQNIVIQEMVHFALAGNMLTAIKGPPEIANAGFVPSYPTNVLPGGIPQKLAVDLQPLSRDQLQVFMQIENPEFPPVALTAGPPPATIGAFYDTISNGFTVVNPTIDPNANFVDFSAVLSPPPQIVQIKTIADAQNAITTIKTEGEGTQGSPDEPPGDSSTFAHYYAFKQIFIGKTLVQTNGKWGFTGAAIQFPTVLPFSPSNVPSDPSAGFNQTLSQLLQQLEACWTTGASFFDTLGTMSTLQSQGTQLIQQKIRPEFLWAA